MFDVSRPTLSKALKSGKISGVRDGKGQWSIDPAELSRLYRPRSADVGKGGKLDRETLPTVNSALPGEAQADFAALKAELQAEKIRREAAEALAEERARHIDDLRRMLPPPDAKPKPRGWWPLKWKGT